MDDEISSLIYNVSNNIEYAMEDYLTESYDLIQNSVRRYVDYDRFLNNVDIYETKRIISRYFRDLASSMYEVKNIIMHNFSSVSERVKSPKDFNELVKCQDNTIDEVSSLIRGLVNKGLGEFDSSFIYDLKYEVLMGMSSSVPYDVILDFKRTIESKVDDSMNMFKSQVDRYIASKLDILVEEYKNIIKNESKKEEKPVNELGMKVKKKIEQVYNETQPFIHNNEVLFISYKSMSTYCDELIAQNADFANFEDERIKKFYELIDEFTIEFKTQLALAEKTKQDQIKSKFKPIEKDTSKIVNTSKNELENPLDWRETRAGKLL